jgi:phosphatidylglycerophosphate synthase
MRTPAPVDPHDREAEPRESEFPGGAWEPDGKADCYSAGEREAMVWGQQVRAAALAPLLRLLARAGITADHLTGASLVFGLAFCPLWLWPGSPAWVKPAALAALLIHVLLDGLDGPLARLMGTASRRGSFTDTVADQIVVTATTLAVMAAPQPPLSIWIGGLYVFVYAMVVGFAMIRNALGVPYSWLLRPRFWVYGWIAVDAYLLPGWMNVVVGALVVLLAWKMATGFMAIRRML